MPRPLRQRRGGLQEAQGRWAGNRPRHAGGTEAGRPAGEPPWPRQLPAWQGRSGASREAQVSCASSNLQRRELRRLARRVGPRGCWRGAQKQHISIIIFIFILISISILIAIPIFILLFIIISCSNSSSQPVPCPPLLPFRGATCATAAPASPAMSRSPSTSNAARAARVHSVASSPPVALAHPCPTMAWPTRPPPRFPSKAELDTPLPWEVQRLAQAARRKWRPLQGPSARADLGPGPSARSDLGPAARVAPEPARKRSRTKQQAPAAQAAHGPEAPAAGPPTSGCAGESVHACRLPICGFRPQGLAAHQYGQASPRGSCQRRGDLQEE